MLGRVVAIIGGYRKGCALDAAVDESLSAAWDQGSQIEKIYLRDHRLDLAGSNAQSSSHETRLNKRLHKPDSILGLFDQADAYVIGLPVEDAGACGTARRFLRLLRSGGLDSRPRSYKADNVAQTPAVLISTASLPGTLLPCVTGATRLLGLIAKELGARPIATVNLGLLGKSFLTDRQAYQAYAAGLRLSCPAEGPWSRAVPFTKTTLSNQSSQTWWK